MATNNVAEYRALLLGLERARALGATEVEVVNDSELVAKQVDGAYKVKHPDLKPLHRAALDALAAFDVLARALGPAGAERRRGRAGQPGARRARRPHPFSPGPLLPMSGAWPLQSSPSRRRAA